MIDAAGVGAPTRVADRGGVMTHETIEDNAIYQVLVNHEEQYSIWPVERDLPEGWRRSGTPGTKADCLAQVAAVWTDMRPLSLRKAMDSKIEIP
jgi:MbtH protein